MEPRTPRRTRESSRMVANGFEFDIVSSTPSQMLKSSIAPLSNYVSFGMRNHGELP